MKTTPKFPFTIILIVFIFIFNLQAQIPQLLNYQGKLTNNNGTPFLGGSLNIRFAIYSDSVSTTALWEETQTVTVKNGIFNVLLGSLKPLETVFDGGGDRYLSLQIGNDPTEMKPRFRLTSVAYAMKANSAEKAQVAVRALSGGDANNTLDQAYDQGGPGAGRTIIADAGPVVIDGQGGLIVNGCSSFWTVELRYQGTPYIDFTNDAASDYDMRFILTGDDALSLEGGRLGIGTTTPEATLDVYGGALLGYENMVNNFGSPLKTGFYSNQGQDIPGNVPDKSHVWTHLIAARHGNTSANYQMQIASTYAYNDRLFFRKIGGGLEIMNPPWYELATRSGNTFSGNQYFMDGNVGIGTTTPAYTFDVRGSIGGTHGLYQSSDFRWKQEIRNLSHSLNNILKLQGVSFIWRQEEYPGMHFPSDRTVGFIGQEVEKVLPELVNTNQDGFKSVDYTKMSVYLVEAIKELKAENDQLKQELEELKNLIQKH